MKYENEKLMEEILQRGGKAVMRRRKNTRRMIAIGAAAFFLWTLLLSIRVTCITPSGSEEDLFRQWVENRPDPGGIEPEPDPGPLPGAPTPPEIDVGAWVPPGVGEGGNQKLFIDEPYRIEEAARSVVKLTVYDRDGSKIATGTGFCAYESTILVTSAHVVTNMDYMIAEKDDGETFRIDRVIEGSTEKDIAICRIPEDAGLQPLPESGTYPERGGRVAVIGSQFGLTNLVTLGNVAGMWENEGTQRVLFTAPVSSGNSGGPVLNTRGELVGIVTGTYDKGQNMNVAVSISEATDIYYNTMDTESES